MSITVYVGGQKGGTAKTTTAHLLCLGSVLMKQPAAYVLTDPKRKLKSEGRPYGVLDGREPTKLAEILAANHSTLNGWLVIDGGGNRPLFDKTMADEVDLCLLPYRDSEEDFEMVKADLETNQEALAWPAAWPTNEKAAKVAQRYIDNLMRDFPDRVISLPIYFINSAKELLANVLGEPSTLVRGGARRAFDIMSNYYEVLSRRKASNRLEIPRDQSLEPTLPQHESPS
jgi:chromosome partitioning protein